MSKFRLLYIVINSCFSQVSDAVAPPRPISNAWMQLKHTCLWKSFTQLTNLKQQQRLLENVLTSRLVLTGNFLTLLFVTKWNRRQRNWVGQLKKQLHTLGATTNDSKQEKTKEEPESDEGRLHTKAHTTIPGPKAGAPTKDSTRKQSGRKQKKGTKKKDKHGRK